MVKITNEGEQTRGLPVTSKHTSVEISKGESLEMSAPDWDAIKGHAGIAALVADGVLKVEGDDAKAKKQAKSDAKTDGAA